MRTAVGESDGRSQEVEGSSRCTPPLAPILLPNPSPTAPPQAHPPACASTSLPCCRTHTHSRAHTPPFPRQPTHRPAHPCAPPPPCPAPRPRACAGPTAPACGRRPRCGRWAGERRVKRQAGGVDEPGRPPPRRHPAPLPCIDTAGARAANHPAPRRGAPAKQVCVARVPRHVLHHPQVPLEDVQRVELLRAEGQGGAREGGAGAARGVVGGACGASLGPGRAPACSPPGRPHGQAPARSPRRGPPASRQRTRLACVVPLTSHTQIWASSEPDSR